MPYCVWLSYIISERIKYRRVRALDQFRIIGWVLLNCSLLSVTVGIVILAVGQNIDSFPIRVGSPIWSAFVVRFNHMTQLFLYWKLVTQNCKIIPHSRKFSSQAHGALISFPPPPFSLLPPFFQNFHINHSFFKIFIIIRFFFIWQYQ